MRKPRHLEDDARYHVTARANHRDMLLEPVQVKNLLLDTIARAKKKYHFNVENFSILGNHIHLLIHVPTGSNLSQIMKWILGVFAMAWNRLHSSWGHFWGDRFFSRLLSSPQEYGSVYRYIDDNPVAAGLVPASLDWPFGGLYHRLRGIFRILSPLPEWAVDVVGDPTASDR